LKRLLLGSVAEKVVRTSLTNVLVARGEPTAFARILVATDFSPASERALQVALGLGAGGDVQIDVLHAWQYPAGTYGLKTPEPTSGPLVELHDQIVHQVDTLGQALVQRYSTAQRPVRFVRAFGGAREVVHNRLESHAYDLVAMGTHGYRGFQRFLLGSVAEATVRHAPCSVLIAHPHDSNNE
jgi:nucleotide-binding universal stress UspA family protein